MTRGTKRNRTKSKGSASDSITPEAKKVNLYDYFHKQSGEKIMENNTDMIGANSLLDLSRGELSPILDNEPQDISEKDLNTLSEKELLIKLLAENNETKTILLKISNDVEELKHARTVDSQEINELKDKVKTLEHEKKKQDTSINQLKNEIEKCKRDRVEDRAYSMRSNLLIHNVESTDNSQTKIQGIFKEMKIEGNEHAYIKTERMHRISSAPGSPVIVRFSFFSDRMSVWKARKTIKSPYRITEHFPIEIEARRREILPLLGAAKERFKIAYPVKDYLICDGKRYSVDNIDDLLSQLNDDPGSRTNEHVYVFSGKYSSLSNFYPCQIKIDGKSFSSAEQAYQFCKAETTGRDDICARIMSTSNPYAIKKAGDMIVDREWISSGEATKQMKIVLQHKFQNCEPAKRVLIASTGKRLGEATRSAFWATGISKYDTKALQPNKWSGSNHLAKLLEGIRTEIVQSNGHST